MQGSLDFTGAGAPRSDNQGFNVIGERKILSPTLPGNELIGINSADLIPQTDAPLRRRPPGIFQCSQPMVRYAQYINIWNDY